MGNFSGHRISFARATSTVTTLFSFCVLALFSRAAGQRQPRPLEGRTVNCCAVPEFPIVFSPDNQKRNSDGTSTSSELSGIGIDYLHAIEDRLGFKCNFLTLPFPQNESFNSIVYGFEGCSNGTFDPATNPICGCELGVGAWMRTKERFDRVDFLPQFIRMELRVIVHVENTDSSIRGDYFLTTFTPVVWALIVGLFALFTFLKFLDAAFAPAIDGDNGDGSPFMPLDRSEPLHRRVKYFLLKYRPLYRLRKSVGSAMSRLINGAGDGEPSGKMSSRQWILNFLLMLCSVFLALTYGATMTTSLVQESLNSAYHTVADLRSCRVSSDDMCLPRAGIQEEIWDSIVVGKTAHRCPGSDFPRLFDSFDETVEAVASKECKFAIVDAATAGEATTGKHCGSVVVTGEPVFWGEGSFIVPVGSNLTGDLARATIEHREAGGVETLDSFFSRWHECKSFQTTVLNFDKLRLFFILAYAACLVLLILMLANPQTPPDVHYGQESKQQQPGQGEQDENDKEGEGR